MQVLGAGLAYGSFATLARNMSTSDYGQLQYILSWSILLGIFGGLGIPLWAPKSIPLFRSRSELGKLKGFLIFSYASMFLASVLIAGVFFFAFHLHEKNPSLWFWGALLIPVTAIINLQVGYGRITGQIFTAHFPINIARHVLLAGSVVALPALAFQLSPTNVLIFTFVGLFITMLIQGVIILPKLWPESQDKTVIRSLPWLNMSLVFMGIGAGAFAMEQADVLVLGLLKTKTEVAHYFAANRTAALIGLIYFSFYAALVPVLSNLYHSNEFERLRKLLKTSSLGMITVSALALVMLLGFHKQILGLFGPNYTDVFPELTILCLSQMAMAFIGLSEGFLSMTDQPKTSLKIYMFSVGINVGCNFLLIPWFGTLGAAGATFASKAALSFLMIRAARLNVDRLLLTHKRNKVPEIDTTKPYKISVCMASYNGARFLPVMVPSILSQIGPDDELIIIDDCSEDNSYEVIQGYDDPRVIIDRNQRNLGPQKSFKKALMKAHGDIIFLADQDDVWLDGKVKKSVTLLLNDPDTLLVAHEAQFTDENLNHIPSPILNAENNKSFWRILLKNRFIGATMCVHRSLAEEALPLLGNTPMHDWWLVLLASLKGKVGYISEPLILYRRHDRTVTVLQSKFRLHLRGLIFRVQYLFLLIFFFFVSFPKNTLHDTFDETLQVDK